MAIKMIVAIGGNREIGGNNELLWDIPQDLAHFRKTTFGKTIVMGRKTYDSIIKRTGRPLLNRKNIVLTRNLNPNIKGCFQTDNINDILSIEEDVYIIGGSEIYQLFLPYANELIVTHVVEDYPEADSLFPEFDLDEWDAEKILEHNLLNLPPYLIIRYKRIKNSR
jgi:dihydrofolate reductase